MAGTEWCHFFVYVYNGIIVLKIPFDEDYFLDVVKYLASFYKQYYLSRLVKIYKSKDVEIDFDINLSSGHTHTGTTS